MSDCLANYATFPYVVFYTVLMIFGNGSGTTKDCNKDLMMRWDIVIIVLAVSMVPLAFFPYSLVGMILVLTFVISQWSQVLLVDRLMIYSHNELLNDKKRRPLVKIVDIMGLPYFYVFKWLSIPVSKIVDKLVHELGDMPSLEDEQQVVKWNKRLISLGNFQMAFRPIINKRPRRI